MSHKHEPVVGVEGNANWKISHGYGAHNSVCRRVYHGDGVTGKFVTYMNPLSGLKAMPIGHNPTGMVATTVFVVGSITETVLLLMFVTYKNPLSGLKAMPYGCSSHRYGGHNGVCCAVYHRDGVTHYWFATYKTPLSGLKAMPSGLFPQVWCATTVFVVPVYHGDGVDILVCHIHKPVVWVEGNAYWI